VDENTRPSALIAGPILLETGREDEVIVVGDGGIGEKRRKKKKWGSLGRNAGSDRTNLI